MGATLRRKLEHTFVGKDGESWDSFYFDNFFSAFGGAEQEGLLTREFAAAIRSRHSLRQRSLLLGTFVRRRHLLQRLLYTDIKTYLVELLMKQDNMSMAASIESRVPFLDHVLVEFATRIPPEIQIKVSPAKRILKKAVEDLLPHEILYRPKLGFPTPWSGWLAGARLETIRNMLLEPRSLHRGYFKPRGVRAIQ